MISVGVVVSWTTWWTVWFIQRYFVVTLDPSLTRYGSLAREYVFKVNRWCVVIEVERECVLCALASVFVLVVLVP